MESLILLKLLIFCRGPAPRFFLDRWEFMEYSTTQVTEPGDWCEFGVFQGESIRFTAARTKGAVHGFDTFHGLQESWGGMGVGAYSTEGRLPEVPSNVILHVGYFERTIPEFIQQRAPAPLAFAHIDSDLYGSAVTVLREIRPFLRPGTIVVFDELLGVFHNDEYSAFLRELPPRELRMEWIGFYLFPEWGVSACLRVLSPSPSGGPAVR
jgi:hypothetical protein